MVSLANLRHEFGEHGGVNMSIATSTTFTVLVASTMPDIFQGRRGPEQGGCYLYGRHFNPTVYVLGRQLAAIEDGEAGYCTSSGMGAISSVALQLCNQGDHIVCSDTIYGGTFAFFRQFLPAKTGIEVTFVDIADTSAVRAAMRDNTRMVYCESLANPTLKVADIPALASIAHEGRTKLVVDNTFSPLTISPLRHGADVVIHSLTKFINGASDIVAGAIVGSTEFITELMGLTEGSLMLLGPTMDPREAYTVSTRLPHLGLRVREHSRRALLFAERLEERGVPVLYPGIESHPGHQTMTRIFNEDYGYGGLIGLDMGTTRRASELMEILQNKDGFGFIAVSLGYSDTLMSCPTLTTSSELDDEEKARAGVVPGLVRLSLGITGSAEQRWNQLADALDVLNM